MIQKRIRQVGDWYFWPTLAFVGLFLLVLFLRIHRLDSVPPGIHFDEVINGEIAVGIRENGLRLFYLPGWGREGLYHAFLAASMSLPLPIAWQMRLPAVLFSLTGVLLTYGWVRRYFGNWAAITAAAGLGVSLWSLNLGRSSLRAAAVLPLSAGVIWLMLNLTSDGSKGLSTRNQIESSLRLGGKILLLAILMGALFYTYRAARVLPALYLFYLAYLALWHRPLSKGYLLALFGASLIVLPLVAFLLTHPGAELRVGQVDRPWQELLGGNIGPILRSSLATLGMFGWEGDLADHYNLAGRPVFEPLGFMLFLVGVIGSTFHWKKQPYALVLMWLLAGLLPGMVTEPAPHFIHTVVAMPVVFVFPGIAVAGLSKRLDSRYGMVSRFLLAASLAIWIIGNAIWSYRDYFLIWPNQAQVRSFQQSSLANVSRYLDQVDTRITTSICSEFLNEQDPFWRSGRQTIPFLLNDDASDLRWFDCRNSHVIPQSATTVRYVFFDGSEFAEWLSDGSTPPSTASNPFYGDGFWTVEIDAGEMSERYLSEILEPDGERRPVNLGNMVSFLGYRIGSDSIHPGEIVTIDTAWQVVSPLPKEMAVFVHVMDDDGSLITQGDALTLLSDTLQPGDVVIQRHAFTFPGNIGFGEYSLSVGFYSRMGTIPPLQIIHPESNSPQGDRLWLEPIKVVEP